MSRLGVDLGGTKIEALVLDDAGGEAFRARVATPRGDYDATVHAVAALAERAEAAVGPLEGIGIGTPGRRVPATGLMKNCNSTWLNGRPLLDDLRNALDRPVVLANDADCFALSEATDGAAAGRGSAFGVILGTGVGGGIVVEGRLLQGPNGLAGEWGHNPQPSLAAAPEPVQVRHAGLATRPCYCGRRDCIETWLSGPGLVRTCRELGAEVGSGEEAVARGGEPAVAAALDLHAWQLAAGLAGVINLLDPEAIVLGGGLSAMTRLYNAVPERWGRFVFGDEVRTSLLPPRFGAASGVRGAARLQR